MNEEKKEAIDEIKKDDEYLNILQDIKKNKYNMYNVAKLMKDTTTGDYTEYEIAESIVYFVKLVEKQQKEIDKQNKVIDEMAEVLNDFDYDKQCEFCHTDICSASVDRTEYTKCIKQFFIRKVEEDE